MGGDQEKDHKGKLSLSSRKEEVAGEKNLNKSKHELWR